MKTGRPMLLLARRLAATDARRGWVELLRKVADDGKPVEITRRQRQSVFVVRASDFEEALGCDHPWAGLRARLAPRTFRPNGLEPGVTHRWENLSSTRARARLGQVLERVDGTDEPWLVTRQGQCGLMLVSVRVMELHWNGVGSRGSDSGADKGQGMGRIARAPGVEVCP